MEKVGAGQLGLFLLWRYKQMMAPVYRLTYCTYAKLTICNIDPWTCGRSLPSSAMGYVSSIWTRKRCRLARLGRVQTLKPFRGARPTVTGLKFAGQRACNPGAGVSRRILIFCLQTMPLLCGNWVSGCQSIQAAAYSFIVRRQHDRNAIHHHKVRVTHGALLVASTSETDELSQRMGACQQHLRTTAELE